MHASSCNGHIECVQLLLEHAVNPLVKNCSGLTPGQVSQDPSIVELLKEYGDDGASVIMTSPRAVESEQYICNSGGRMSAEEMRNSGTQNETSFVSPDTQATNHWNIIQDMVHGEWSAHFDSASQCTYYYNSRTGNTQWEMPQEWDEINLSTANRHAGDKLYFTR